MRTSTTFKPQPLTLAVGGALLALGFRLVVDGKGQRHLYWPDDTACVVTTMLPGETPDEALHRKCERSGAMKALVHLVRRMSPADSETLFAAFAEFESAHSFDFRRLLSA